MPPFSHILKTKHAFLALSGLPVGLALFSFCATVISGLMVKLQLCAAATPRRTTESEPDSFL